MANAQERDHQVIQLSCLLHVKADISSTPEGVGDIPGESSAQAYVPVMALAIETMTSRLFGDADRLRQRVRAGIRGRGTHDDDAPPLDERSTLPPSIFGAEILWELSDDFGFHSGFVIESVGSAVRRAVAGDFNQFSLGFWHPQTSRFSSASIVCVDAEFSAGSLKGTFKLTITATSLVLSLLFAGAATPWGADRYHRRQISQEITALYGSDRGTAVSIFEIDGDALLDATARELDVHADGLTQYEYSRRVALLQLALDLNKYYPGPIDGSLGPETLAAFGKFAKERGLPNDINHPATRRVLTRALHEAAWQLARN